MSKNVNNDVSKDSPIAKGVRWLVYAAFPRVKRKGLYCDSNTIIHIELDFVTWNLSTYHLLPPGSVLGIPPRTQREPRGGTILLFFFPRGEEGSLVLETTTMDHGDILARFVRGRQGEKCFTWYPGRRVKMIKKNCKKWDTFVCYFCQWKGNIILWSDNKRLKKVVMLFLTTSQRCVVRVRTFLKGRPFCHWFYALYLVETQIMQETNSTKALI